MVQFFFPYIFSVLYRHVPNKNYVLLNKKNVDLSKITQLVKKGKTAL